jgi:hypothetical protein
MGKSLAARLLQLESMRQSYGPGCAAEAERVLGSLAAAKFRDVESLIRFHDVLLFLRAFPQSRQVIELTERMLMQVFQQVKQLRASGADMEMFDPEEVSGIAGTELNYTFTYEVARWLYGRFPKQVRAEWDFDEQAPRLGITLPRFIPLLEDDALVEAYTPFPTWLSSAAGEGLELSWLLNCLEQSPLSLPEKTELYDALNIDLHWDLTNSPASRTLARRAVSDFFYHQTPLIQRKQVSLADELSSVALPLRKLSRPEAEEILDMCRDAVTVRYRELYGTTRGDPDQCYQADVGRGVQVFLWGLPRDRRLPLRAYHAGFTLKNGVPINYIEGISLFEWMEIGFNTFYTFRDGETAWIYSKVIHLLHQLTGVTCISVYPYQLGNENEEAIKSGAFWFYRKLGFRPGRPELLSLTEQEERKIRKDPEHRTSARSLRKLAAGHVFYEFGDGPKGLWDTFSTRNIGFAVQRRMAKEFGGSAQKMRHATTTELARLLDVDLSSLSQLETAAFGNFALILSLVPDVKRWTSEQQQAIVDIIRAKVAPDETAYLRLLQKHGLLRKELLRLGSAESDKSKTL